MKAVEGFRLYFPEREIQVATSWEVADWRYLGSSKFKHKQETDFASFMGKFYNIISTRNGFLQETFFGSLMEYPKFILFIFALFVGELQ
jgi:hypothetical protein